MSVGKLTSLFGGKTMKRLPIVFSLCMGLLLLVSSVALATELTVVRKSELSIRAIQRISKKVEEVFAQLHPNIKINWIYIPWDQFDEKVDMLIASGHPPAIWAPAAKRGYRYYADKGMFINLDPLIKKDNYNLSDFYPIPLEFCKWAGHYMALPYAQWHCFEVYNKDLFDEAGIAYPPTSWEDNTWTFDRYLEIARKLTKKDARGKIVQFGIGVAADDRFPTYIFGGDWFPKKAYETGKPTKCIANSPDSIKGLQFIADLANKYHVMPNPMEAEAIRTGLPDIFASGRIGMSLTYSWSFQWLKDIKHFRWGIAPVPKVAPGRRQKVVLYPDQWASFKGKNLEARWDLLKIMESPEIMKMGFEARRFMPARQSVTNEVVYSWLKEEVGISSSEVKTVIDSVKYSQVSASHAIPCFAELYDTIIAPQLDALWLGKKSAKEIVDVIVPKVNDKLREWGYAE